MVLNGNIKNFIPKIFSIKCYNNIIIIVMNSDEIKALRQQLNLSQEKFAIILGVSFATVNRWEKGHNRPCGKALYSLNLIKSILEESKVVEVSNLIGSLALNPFSIFMPVDSLRSKRLSEAIDSQTCNKAKPPVSEAKITETLVDLILTLKRRNNNGR